VDARRPVCPAPTVGSLWLGWLFHRHDWCVRRQPAAPCTSGQRQIIRSDSSSAGRCKV